MGECIIEFQDVDFSYGDLPALENVNLHIEKGASGCIIGPNGGGKSTLLKLILGLLEPTCGTIKVFGVRPDEARLRVGYMPQYHLLDSAFPATVLEVVLMGRMRPMLFRYNREDRVVAMAALEELGVADLAKRKFSELSGGQRQRILIARALAGEPDLLLLDEPTANIDPGSEKQFYATLENLRSRMTTLTVSHDLGFVSGGSDLVVCVNRRVSLHHAERFSQETADEVYGHRVDFIHHDHACFCNCCDKKGLK